MVSTSQQVATTTMDSIITFPPPEPDLKLARPSAEKWAATLAEERMRFQEDQDALREREENLRDNETRLRLLQSGVEAGRGSSPSHFAMTSRSPPSVFQSNSSRAPFGGDSNLAAAWEKLPRAREILDAEQRNLRDDRISIRDLEVMVK